MTPLARADVERIAYLARIALSDDELADAEQQINNTLALIDAMQAVDTHGIEPMAHVGDWSQRLREDRVSESNQRSDWMANAPEQADGLFLVPKVIG